MGPRKSLDTEAEVASVLQGLNEVERAIYGASFVTFLRTEKEATLRRSLDYRGVESLNTSPTLSEVRRASTYAMKIVRAHRNLTDFDPNDDPLE